MLAGCPDRCPSPWVFWPRWSCWGAPRHPWADCRPVWIHRGWRHPPGAAGIPAPDDPPGLHRCPRDGAASPWPQGEGVPPAPATHRPAGHAEDSDHGSLRPDGNQGGQRNGGRRRSIPSVPATQPGVGPWFPDANTPGHQKRLGSRASGEYWLISPKTMLESRRCGDLDGFLGCVQGRPLRRCPAGPLTTGSPLSREGGSPGGWPAVMPLFQRGKYLWTLPARTRLCESR